MPGTHWLHPHRHGSTALQVGGGAASAIIVEDSNDADLPPEVRSSVEVIMILQQLYFDRVSRMDSSKLFQGGLLASSSPSGRVHHKKGITTVNGQLEHVIRTNPGQWMRLRLINAGWRGSDIHFTVYGCEMYLLAKDGIYIRDYPRSIDKATIWTGGRSDIMVRCMEPDTSYEIGNHEITLATIQTSNNATFLEDMSIEVSSTHEVAYPPYLEDLVAVSPTPGCSCKTNVGWPMNGYEFQPDSIFHQSVLGSIVERQLDAGDHPYHQHVYPFQVVQGFHDIDDGDAYNENGDWHDVVEGNSLVIKYHPREFVSKIMVHCHRLVHEDEGMMAVEQVLPEFMEDGITPNTCSCIAVKSYWYVYALIVVALIVIICSIAWCIWRRLQCCSSRGGSCIGCNMLHDDVTPDDTENPSTPTK